MLAASTCIFIALNKLILSDHFLHEVQAIAESSIAEDGVLRACSGSSWRFPLSSALHSHSLALALWCNYVLGDNRRAYIYSKMRVWYLTNCFLNFESFCLCLCYVALHEFDGFDFVENKTIFSRLPLDRGFFFKYCSMLWRVSIVLLWNKLGLLFYVGANSQ